MSDNHWDASQKAWRTEMIFFNRPSAKNSGVPPARLAHCNPCVCGDRQRDHEELRGRCWVCGTGRGEGCQKFRRPETRPDAAPPV